MKDVLEKLRRRIADRELDDRVGVRYHVTGGSSGERTEYFVELAGSGGTEIRASDQLQRGPTGTLRETLSGDQVADVFASVIDALDELSSQEQGPFPFDAEVAEISAMIDGERVSVAFLVEDLDAPAGKRIAVAKETRARMAMDRFLSLRAHLKSKGDGDE